ncbi:MAG: hypothetical protein R3B93_01870 [Bacteroidia bacterium]
MNTVVNVLPGFTETERLEEIIQANAKNRAFSWKAVAASGEANYSCSAFCLA